MSLVNPSELRAALDLPPTVLDVDLQVVCDAASTVLERLMTKTTADGTPIDHSVHDADREAALAVAGQIWQQRQAPGGAMSGFDLQIQNPYLLGRGLIARVETMIAGCRSLNGMIG